LLRKLHWGVDTREIGAGEEEQGARGQRGKWRRGERSGWAGSSQAAIVYKVAISKLSAFKMLRLPRLNLCVYYKLSVCVRVCVYLCVNEIC